MQLRLGKFAINLNLRDRPFCQLDKESDRFSFQHLYKSKKDIL